MGFGDNCNPDDYRRGTDMGQSTGNRAIRRVFMGGILLCLHFSIMSANAGGLAGADDPALKAAIEIWLADDDENSLPVMAELAAGGNIAARLLLARIEDTERAPSDFVANLSRKERVALFRSSAGKGIFRPSWLKSEAKAGNEIAATLLQAGALEVSIEAIKHLYAIGEIESAYDLIRQVAGNGNTQEKDELAGFLPASSELAPYLEASRSGINAGLAVLQMIVDQADGVTTAPDSDTLSASEYLEWGYQNGVRSISFDRANRHYEAIADWISMSAVTAPIANLCRSLCTEEGVPACAVASFALVGGYYKAIRFDSPLQALIEQDSYVSSPRATGMLLRRITGVKDATGGQPLMSIAELSDTSACLAKAVAAGTGS